MALHEVKMATLPRFSFDFDHYDQNKSVRVILEHFRPDWFERLDNEALRIEDLAGGYTNKLMVIYFENDPTDKILIRIYGADTDKSIDRKAELRILQVLSERKICGEVYGVFGNGMCYEYVKGEALEQGRAGDPHISKLIIEKLVHLHCIQHQHHTDQTSIFDKIHTMLHHIPTSYTDSSTQSTFLSLEFPNPEYFESEIESLRTALTTPEEASPQVFCHNDLYYRNILYDEEANQIRLIDFEYAGLNYQAFDIGNHFNEWCGVDDVDYSRYPSKEVQREWLVYYIRCWNGAHRREGEEIAKEEVERMYRTVNRFALVAHLFWIIWCFQQAESSTIEFDYLTYAKKRLDEYRKRKSILF